MICVIDASAAVEIVLRKSEAVDLINRIMTADKVIAPALFYAETGNTFRKYVQGGFFDKEIGVKLFQASLKIVDEFSDISSLIDEALNEAIRLKHSVYDMLYLVLARRSGAKLLTCDKKMQTLYDSLLA
jgi:predicted nucleic acid-binding protein